MLTRGVPASVLLHALAVAAMLLWGNMVGRPATHTPNVISVRLVGSPGGGRTAPPSVEPEPQATAETTAPPERPDPVRPAKEVPREKPKEKPKDKVPPRTGPKPAAVGAETGRPAAGSGSAGSTSGSGTNLGGGSGSGVSGTSISGTDSDFPFAYYVQAVESRIVANWQPRQLGFGKRAVVSCSVHFVIARSGAISQVRLVRNSGVGVYDREADRAVRTAKLPPLPPQYRGNDLGVTFDFNLEPEVP